MAVSIIVALAVALAVATFIESSYDAPTARYYIYRSWWFFLLLALFGVNILSVALSRWPWKRRHTPFLLAHLGILLMLGGAWIQAFWGIDGTLALQEGESLSLVELEGHQLALLDDGNLTWHQVPWLPPTKKFTPISIPKFPFKIDEYLTHADSRVKFEASPIATDPPAVHLKIDAPWLGIFQDVWLWGGDFSLSSMVLGPAKFILLPRELDFSRGPLKEARLEIKIDAHQLRYRAFSKSGSQRSGGWPLQSAKSKHIETGWMAGKGRMGGALQIEVLDALPASVDRTQFVPARAQYGESAPPPAIRLGDTWIGLGEKRRISVARDYDLAFQPVRIRMPFSIRLEQFKMDHDPGTQQPSSYASLVTVIDPARTFSTWISMNEPLHWGGYTFYQASFVPAAPGERPTISVFSANYDPGRPFKYSGSILIVLGAILLFAVKSMPSQSRLARWLGAKS